MNEAALALMVSVGHRTGLFDVMAAMPAPASLRELAADLFVTPNTLQTHLRATYRKLGPKSREEAVIRAREGGLI